MFGSSKTAAVVDPTLDPNRSKMINVPHLKSVMGLIRIALIALAIIVIICLSLSIVNYHDVGWFWFVAITSLIIAGVFLGLYVFNVHLVLHKLPWHLIELILSAIWAFFWFINLCIAADFAASLGTGLEHHVLKASREIHERSMNCYAVIAFLSLCSAAAWGYNAYLHLRQWQLKKDIRKGIVPQV